MTLDIELGENRITVTAHYTLEEGQAETRTDPPYPTIIEMGEIKHKGEDIQSLLSDDLYFEVENQLYQHHGLEND